ncbi:phage holin family protein [Chitinibacter sp. ZOR0017]|uniref:phage holin family protein n=1 Tax=Chitinibacter sp. ZOR0017 TaxID=1339254 RepID=UPI000647C4D1|nr:phage holin family protein [Chitinibacter sp. ZOR0017]
MAMIREALAGLLSTRLSLLGLELRDELDRVALMVGLAIAAALALLLGLCFFGLLLLFGFWSYRIVISAIFAVLFLGLGLVAWLWLRRLQAEASQPFPLTTAEFAQDKQLLAQLFNRPPAEAADE